MIQDACCNITEAFQLFRNAGANDILVDLQGNVRVPIFSLDKFNEIPGVSVIVDRANGTSELQKQFGIVKFVWYDINLGVSHE